MLVQGSVLLDGTFYLSPFLCKFLAVPGCLLFVAVCIYLWFPHPQKNVTSLSFLSFVLLCVFTLLPLTLQSFLQAVAALPWNWLAGNAGSLQFPLAEQQWYPSSPQCTFCLFTRVLLALTCSWWMLYICWRDVSLNSVAAPCCYSKINRSILIGFIPLFALFF